MALTFKNIKFFSVKSFIVFILIYLAYIMRSALLKKPNDKLRPFDNAKYKKILLWNSLFYSKDYYFGFGNEPFYKKSCEDPFCYVTNDRNWMDVDLFDAIVFHVPEFHPEQDKDVPMKRRQFQRYVFYSSESPSNRAVSSKVFNNFYNWTVSYRLDSDIENFYFSFRNKEGHVAPSQHPNWRQYEMDDEKLLDYTNIARNKTRPVAWFVSNCKTKNNREGKVNKLKDFIQIDVYGSCGTMVCPRSDSCSKKLKEDYFFYLAFENSNCQDYITEKVVLAMENDVIPVVYGGANLEKFLPPKSYLDAKKLPPRALANKMKYLIDNPEEYAKYFWWKDWYTIGLYRHPFCRLCEMLHDRTQKSKTYKIHEWWHGYDYDPVCKDS